MQNPLAAFLPVRSPSTHWNRTQLRFVTGAPHQKGSTMNRNVTIGLGTLIIIIIIVALVF